MRRGGEHFAALVAGILNGFGDVARVGIARVAVGILLLLGTANRLDMFSAREYKLTDLEDSLHNARVDTENRTWPLAETKLCTDGMFSELFALDSSSLTADHLV